MALEGVESTKLVIKGQEYMVPLANKEYVSDLYWLKKALNGDKDAYDMILGSKEVRWFFIGDTYPLWAKITRYDVEVVKP